MKLVKNEKITIDRPLLCDDCGGAISQKAIRIYQELDPGNTLLLLHPRCAIDFGGDLVVEIAR